jgi:alpha-beta hydrolase superfamily lysophospholipase
MGLHVQGGGRAKGLFGVLCVAVALVWSSATKAETRVYLLRGWFGVFSTGLDTVAAELRGKGIKAETVGHLAWKTTISNIIKWHASGDSGPLVLVGHSQGANNVIDMARSLQRENIPVDLLVTLAPAMQDPIPGNVVRAINYYNSPGWGAPITADAGYRGKLTNINLGGDIGLYHMAIDKNPRVQAEIERAILAVRQPQAQAEAQAR